MNYDCKSIRELITKLEGANDSIRSYSSKVVINMLKDLNSNKSLVIEKPTRLKRVDVYVSMAGYKNRPAVVVKVIGDTVVSIPFSKTEDELNLCKSNSRFFEESFISKGFWV